ncbi:hypothetical protein D1007_44349 [Hordeum vulgare]|nr:hypothetical protein D1007_44349 [Hordeum vulgare]
MDFIPMNHWLKLVNLPSRVAFIRPSHSRERAPRTGHEEGAREPLCFYVQIRDEEDLTMLIIPPNFVDMMKEWLTMKLPHVWARPTTVRHATRASATCTSRTPKPTAEKEGGKKSVTPDVQGTKSRQDGGSGSRIRGTPGKERKAHAKGASSVVSRTPDASASLSAKLGGMVLMEKEAQGLVFSGPNETVPAAKRWTLIGKACTPRAMNFGAVERSLRRAWGLHHDAQFRDLGNNIFLVHFGGEGDWKHARNNGPWKFDFNVLILKDYDGKTRPSEMIFDTVEVWVRIEDLPLDRRTKEFGEVLGNWLGEVVKVDVENDGFAKGKYLRVRAKISVYEPLVRYFNLKESKEDEEGTWFNFSYEKIPHFCFECGSLVHAEGRCDPPVDKSSQWGEWLRASLGRNSFGKGGGYGGVASSSFSGESSRTGGSDPIRFPSVRVRDLPTKRNLQTELSQASYSHTGERVQRDKNEGRELDLRQEVINKNAGIADKVLAQEVP